MAIPFKATELVPKSHYRLIGKLGSGAFGEVWECELPSKFRHALKFIPSPVEGGDKQQLKEDLEHRALEYCKTLRHAHLIRIFDAWTIVGFTVIAMELAEDTLLNRFNECRAAGGKGIPRDELLGYIRDAARGIDYLNEPRHVIGSGEPVALHHCDIKPANILLMGGTAKVADFGIAHPRHHTITQYPGYGTPPYAAVEFFDKQLSRWSDQYSLAATYFEMLVGTKPFVGQRDSEIIAAHRSGKLDLNLLPERDRPIVARALNPNPQLRWPTCTAFVDALSGEPRTSFGPSLLPLPAVVSDFTGRKDEIRRMAKRLRGTGGKVGLSALRGMGGIGKTSLAVMVAYAVKDRFPDGQWLLELQGTSDRPMTAAEAMARVIRELDPSLGQLPETHAGLLPVYRRILADKRALILLDNARNEEQVKQLITVGPPVGFIITSRNALELDGVESIRLDVLAMPEALRLLRGIIGKKPRSNELQQVAELCGRLPLALRVAGDFLRLHEDWSVPQYVEALKAENKRLRLLKGKTKEKDIEAVLALSAAELVKSNPEQAERWQMLSVFPGDFGVRAAATIWGFEKNGELDAAAAKAELSHLLARSLLQFDANAEGYDLHDLMRPVAQEAFTYVKDHPRQAGSASRIHVGERRLSGWFLKVLANAAAFFARGKKDVLEGLKVFDRDAHNIRRGQQWAAEHRSEDEAAAQLCWGYSIAGGRVTSLRLSARERMAWHQAALQACEQFPDKKAEAGVLLSLGNACADLGNYSEAIGYYEQQLAIARKLKDREEEGNALTSLGVVHRESGDPGKALEYYKQALPIFRELHTGQDEGHVLTNMGVAYLHLGDTSAAIQHHKEALPIAHELEDDAEGHTLCNLGDAYLASGDAEAAIKSYKQALIIINKIGDERERGESIWGLARAFRQLGRHAEAIKTAAKALAIIEATEHPKAKEVRGKLAEWRVASSPDRPVTGLEKKTNRG